MAKPPDPARLNPSRPLAPRGITTPIAEWAARQAQSLLTLGRGVRAPAPGASNAAGSALVPATQTQVTNGLPMNAPAQPGPPAMVRQGVMVAERREPWFGPGRPMTPAAPAQDVAGRQFDYRPGENMQTRPRQYSGTSFEMLRGFADALDIARLCIETRKDQIGALTFSFLPKQKAGEQKRAKGDARCAQLEQFFRSPDRRQTWDSWVRMLLEEMFVVDAASIYVRRTNGGDPFSLEIVDGGTIKPLLDVTGRMPLAPAPAYQQILKGIPAIDYTSEELIYAPRNRRSNHVYGFSIIEQILTTVNTAIRREAVRMNYFTSGNVPEALVSTPKEWSPDTVLRFQEQWDVLMKMAETRAGLRFVPGEMSYQPTRSDGMLMGAFDEWIARVVCFAFSLPPTAFVQQMNRATADTAKETALEEGLRPTMVWLKGVVDNLVGTVWSWDDIELVWDDIKDVDPEAEREQERSDMQLGILSMDEVRAKRGLEPLGMGNAIWGGPNGVIFISDLLKMQASGMTMPQPQQQVDQFGNPIAPAMQNRGPALPAPTAGDALPGTPALAAPPVAAAPAVGGDDAPSAAFSAALDGIPPDLLAAVGLGPQGTAGRAVDVSRADEVERDPETAHVSHPQTLAFLRELEAKHFGDGS